MDKTLGSKRQEALVSFLIEKREQLGVTQTELADRLGVYQSFVARMESGQRRVDVVEMLKLAEVLDFQPSELIALLLDV